MENFLANGNMEERQNISSREYKESKAQFRKLEGHVEAKSQGREGQKVYRSPGILFCNIALRKRRLYKGVWGYETKSCRSSKESKD